MHIEVAAPPSAPGKVKGDLLENFAADFLRTQGFEVVKQPRITGSELDLLCRHRVNKRTVYVECKAHREPLSADVVKSLEGARSLHKIREAWLISTGPLGKDAKGLQSIIENDSSQEQSLCIYTPERLVDAFTSAGLLKAPPSDTAEKTLKGSRGSGDWLLLLTEYGRFWISTCLEGGVPVGALVFDASTGELVEDRALLQNVAHTDHSLGHIDFEYITLLQQPSRPPSQNFGPLRVVQVESGDSLDDYRPARPEDFIGREDELRRLIQVVEAARQRERGTRVFALTGDSGMGKSSLILKLRERLHAPGTRKRFFVYVVDVRAATSPAYVLWSVLAALREAAKAGFGGTDPEFLQVSNPSEPLESHSIQEFLQQLKNENRVVVLVFDQFEELYSKPELFPVFEAMQRLLLSASAAQANFVLGFAWKTDSTLLAEHPAYHLWHKISDHRFECRLRPYDYKEATAHVALFERAYSQHLHRNVRAQLIDSSQGFPWLLKKLCIHLFAQLRAGEADRFLVAEDWNVQALFDRDLQLLDSRERACLDAIAKSAPADWYEILNNYSPELVSALQDKRLVIRSGDRLNVYWDIFREYILTGQVQALPITYLPRSPSIHSLLNVAKLLGTAPRAYSDLSLQTGLSENTVANVIRDLVTFGIAHSEVSSARLNPTVADKSSAAILRILRGELQHHALTRQVSQWKAGTIVSADLLITTLKKLNPAAQHTEKTWRLYAERMILWYVATGFLERTQGGVIRRDLGDVNPAAWAGRRHAAKGFGPVFLADSPPLRTIEALRWVEENEPVRTREASRIRGYRNALAVLARMRLVKSDKGQYRVDRKLVPNRGAAVAALKAAATHEPVLTDVIGFIEKNPDATDQELGKYIHEKYAKDWSDSSQRRFGRGLYQWGVWLRFGNDAPARRRWRLGTRKQWRRSRGQPRTRVSLFLLKRTSPQSCLETLVLLARTQPYSLEMSMREDHINQLLLLAFWHLVDQQDDLFVPVEAATLEEHAREALRAAAAADPFINATSHFLDTHPSATNYEVGSHFARLADRNWSIRTRINLGSTLRNWAIWAQVGRMETDKMTGSAGILGVQMVLGL